MKLFSTVRFFVWRKHTGLLKAGLIYVIAEILFIRRMLQIWAIGKESIADYYLLGVNGFFLFPIVSSLIVIMTLSDKRNDFFRTVLMLDRRRFSFYEQEELWLHVLLIMAFYNLTNLVNGFIRGVPCIDFGNADSVFALMNDGTVCRNISFSSILVSTNIYLMTVLIFLSMVTSIIEKLLRSKLLAGLAALLAGNLPAVLGLIEIFEVDYKHVRIQNYKAYLCIWLIHISLITFSFHLNRKMDYLT